MASNSQELLQELLASDPQAREEWNSTYKLKNDLNYKNWAIFKKV